MNPLRLGTFWLALTVQLSVGSAAFGQVRVSREADRIILENESLARTFRLSNGSFQTVAIANKASGRTVYLDSDEFAVELYDGRPGTGGDNERPDRLTARDFLLQSWEELPSDGGGPGLVFRLTEPKYGLRIESRYLLEPGSNLLRKRLSMGFDGEGVDIYRPLIHRLTVESFRLTSGDSLTHGGFGQPAFMGDIFIGMEHPAGFNAVDGRSFESYVYPGRAPETGSTDYPPVVLGVAPENEVEDAFRDYVAGLRRRPPTPFVLYNSWYDLQAEREWPMNRETVAASLGELRRQFEKRGLRLDSYVLDDGYDITGSVYETHPGRFPDGFGPLAEALKKMGSALGLWLSPFAGYDRERGERAAWLAANGYEMSGGRPCLAGERYFEALTSRFEDYIRRYDVNYLKLDGIMSRCSEPDHGHPTGIYSLLAETEALKRMIARFRLVKPDIFINITTGSWLSPWWLADADCVWIGGADYGYAANLPSITRRDLAMTYRDGILYYDFRRKNYRFPLANVMTVGIIKGNYNMLGGTDEPLRKWTDNAVLLAGRGVKMLELYITPQVLTEAEWDNLAAVLKWAEAHSNELAEARMILGDPLRGEVYGFSGFHEDRGLVVLRNPSRYRRRAEIAVDRSLGIRNRKGPWRCLVSYPYRCGLGGALAHGDRLAVVLEPYETRVLEFRPVSGEIIAPAGVRSRPLDGSTGTARLRLYGRPGKKGDMVFATEGKGLEFKLDGKSVRPIRGDNRLSIPYAIPGEAASGPSWTTPRVTEIHDSQGTARKGISIQLEVSVPPATDSPRLVILAEAERDTIAFEAEIELNGEKAVVSRMAEPNNGLWLFGDLTVGRNAVEMNLTAEKGVEFTGCLSLMLEYEARLAEGPVLEVTGMKPRDRSPTLPDFTREERRLETILDRLPLQLKN